MKNLKLKILFPLYCTGSGVSYTCLSLARAMRQAGADIQVHMCAADRDLESEYLHTAVPGVIKDAVYRLCPWQKAIPLLTERLFVSRARPGDIIYLWPSVSLKTYRRLKDRGCTIIVERINCHRLTARRVLDEAYRRCGLTANHGITEMDVAEETAKLSLADFIFSPSPMVRLSLWEAGIPTAKIIDTSYGWDPGRHSPRAYAPSDDITVLFVGRLCLRKGVHLLLDAWKKAALHGSLVLAGYLEPELEKLCQKDLGRSGVVLPGFVSDIAGLYAAADMFVFPSLEEGGPQVTYEAMACGLPVLVSPMGAGAAARDGFDGWIIDPYDSTAWASALQRLANDSDLRRQFGDSGRDRAVDFSWEQVGRRRAASLAAAIERIRP